MTDPTKPTKAQLEEADRVRQEILDWTKEEEPNDRRMRVRRGVALLVAYVDGVERSLQKMAQGFYYQGAKECLDFFDGICDSTEKLQDPEVTPLLPLLRNVIAAARAQAGFQNPDEQATAETEPAPPKRGDCDCPPKAPPGPPCSCEYGASCIVCRGF